MTDNFNCRNEDYTFVSGASFVSVFSVNMATGYGTTCAESNDGKISIRENGEGSAVAPYEYWVVKSPMGILDTTNAHDSWYPSYGGYNPNP